MKTVSENKTPSARAKAIIGGSLLIALGLLVFLARFFDFGLLLVFLPGIVMLAWGIYTRSDGWMIPAGVLNGIALGVLALEGPWTLISTEPGRGGLFLLAFALGWFSIPLFSSLFTKEKHLWALIPGGIMAVIGGAIVAGGAALESLKLFNYIVPAGLILGGLYLIIKKSRQ